MPDIPKVTPTIKTFCTTREAATLLGVSVGTVQLWVESGLLNAWKTAGGHRRVMRESVLALLHKEPESGASQAAVPAPPVLAVQDDQRPRRLSVLVVEDDPVLLRLYEATIKKWPMAPELTLAANGLTALLKLGSYSPDLLVVDLNMAQLDGFEMLRVIRSSPSLDATSIVVFSGLNAAMIAARGGMPPGIEVLPKPVPFERLQAIAVNLVNERRLERRGA
jgi:excisionase family DNA binding protein